MARNDCSVPLLGTISSPPVPMTVRVPTDREQGLAPIAALPMNDWPETAAALDAIWAGIRDAMRARGLAAPDGLTRGLPLMEGWRSPALALGQTCGLPYARGLRGRVLLIGAPDCGLPGCPPGWYRSAVVVRADDAREGLAAFRGARLAVNSADSQSGAGAMMHLVRSAFGDGRFFGATLLSGAHEASAAMVADGRADVAAIDAATWRLIEAHRPAARRLRVLLHSEPTPGLPFIAALERDVEATREALAAGLAAAPPEAMAAAGWRGLVPLEPADYDLVEERDAAVRAIAAAHGLGPD